MASQGRRGSRNLRVEDKEGKGEEEDGKMERYVCGVWGGEGERVEKTGLGVDC